MSFVSEKVNIKRSPVRQCALSRQQSREDELLRFVLGPDNQVVPDIKRKLPGRGVWITADYKAIAESVRRKIFARAFKGAVAVDADLADLTAKLLKNAALQDLALANKAGCVIAGYVKVEKALKSGRRRILAHASDASPDGCRKLDRLARALSQPDHGGSGPIDYFSSAELSGVLGKLNVNHAAIMDEGAGQKFIQSARRYRGYMGPHPAFASAVVTPEQEQA